MKLTENRLCAAKQYCAPTSGSDLYSSGRSLPKNERLSGGTVSPGGHLVGSLVKILAAEKLGLKLMPPSNRGLDALGPQGERVDIKTTTRSTTS